MTYDINIPKNQIDFLGPENHKSFLGSYCNESYEEQKNKLHSHI